MCRKPSRTDYPAKMAYGLTRRIFKHALSEGWIKPGDIVCDPFGGIGSTGIIGAHFGFQVICVELEQKFVDLAKQNFELHRKTIETFAHFGRPFHPVMIQGDSRKLSEIISNCDLLISSPPYERSMDDGHPSNKRTDGTSFTYGFDTPGQLGAMKPGSVDAVISSPPYAESLKGDGTQNETAAESRAKRRTAGGSLGQSQRTQGYGSKGNLGNLKPGSVSAVIGSPPFQASLQSGDTSSSFKAKYPDAKTGGDWGQSYGTSPGNIAALPPGDPPQERRASVAAIISSPPYEGIEQSGGTKGLQKYGTGLTQGKRCFTEYGNAEGQLGRIEGDTFWSAAKLIVEQCHQILQPGGYCIWVVKDFVRNKKRVDFTGDWRRLCEAAGFETIHEHHAMLVKETRETGIFGNEIIKKKERKSFFRRLAENKGSPRIDFENVLCMRKT